MISDEISNDFLRSNSMFGGLTNSELNIVRTFLVQKSFQKGQYILVQGETNSTLYFIISGDVVIKKYHIDPKKDEREIVQLHKGDSFGEMELIDIQNCAASVLCLTDFDTITLSNSSLYQLSTINLKIYTLIIMNLARDISRRLRSTDDLLAMLS
ncbi:MAG: cyclic nucleotide-binding domain-containing protein [Sphaerochaetaceae bacterium]